MRPITLIALGLLCACAGDESTVTPTDDHVHTGIDDPVCEPAGPTVCDAPEASIRGRVRLGDDAPEGARQGSLFIALTHEWLGQGAVGGVPHTGIDLGQVDLDQGPIEFELDMCTGGKMWSEENCSYQLFAIIDTNGNQGQQNLVPDEGELTARISNLDVSCHAETDCLDLVVDCAGPSCVAFEDKTEACACAPNACGSDFVTCR